MVPGDNLPRSVQNSPGQGSTLAVDSTVRPPPPQLGPRTDQSREEWGPRKAPLVTSGTFGMQIAAISTPQALNGLERVGGASSAMRRPP
eukprot:1881495-Pyramimonas_sp.AAC.1